MFEAAVAIVASRLDAERNARYKGSRASHAQGLAEDAISIRVWRGAYKRLWYTCLLSGVALMSPTVCLRAEGSFGGRAFFARDAIAYRDTRLLHAVSSFRVSAEAPKSHSAPPGGGTQSKHRNLHGWGSVAARG